MDLLLSYFAVMAAAILLGVVLGFVARFLNRVALVGRFSDWVKWQLAEGKWWELQKDNALLRAYGPKKKR
jgi:hypothetical protein